MDFQSPNKELNWIASKSRDCGTSLYNAQSFTFRGKLPQKMIRNLRAFLGTIEANRGFGEVSFVMNGFEVNVHLSESSETIVDFIAQN